ncbi:type II toxin-antitoxin system RelE/ParE family toxin [Amantichitinum ursilacus]|uniref:Addiction module killer protein n=1 Tax=Amantichitinum ursilacus TaxID=857265 RepID=A0A0N0XMG1_9NEIS|nr:type II toxin-antitoxin system RelE/ParE family toxin [Amantichitinum ursilacus]KPC54130.1 hypothetical protein WG78_05755 [Amantichitinum ursilacus]
MAIIEVREYVCADDSSPFKDWVRTLAPDVQLKIWTAKNRLEQGNTSAIKWFRGIGEYVIHAGPGYRLYLAQDGATLIILFGGGSKRTQQRDIERALAMHQQYKTRKKTQQLLPSHQDGGPTWH